MREYGYDSEGRLNRQSDDGVATHTWGFDVDGHRTSADGVVSTWDAVGRQATMGGASFSWDVNGNLVSRGDGTTYAFDGDNHLVKVVKGAVVIEYVYDARGRRVARKKNGVVTTGWLYDWSWRVVAEVDAGGATTRRYVYATLANSPDFIETKGKTYALVRDERGSVLEAIDTVSGAVVEAFDYGAWGERTTVASADISSLGYAGGVFDLDTGLTHFGARDYAPVLGTWISPEPMLQDPNFVKSMGLPTPTYAYALNNPVRYVDSDGRFPWTWEGIKLVAKYYAGELTGLAGGAGSLGVGVALWPSSIGPEPHIDWNAPPAMGPKHPPFGDGPKNRPAPKRPSDRNPNDNRCPSPDVNLDTCWGLASQQYFETYLSTGSVFLATRIALDAFEECAGFRPSEEELRRNLAW